MKKEKFCPIMSKNKKVTCDIENCGMVTEFNQGTEKEPIFIKNCSFNWIPILEIELRQSIDKMNFLSGIKT